MMMLGKIHYLPSHLLRTVSLGLAITATSLIPSAHATLTHEGLYQSTDNLLTYDSVTGLSWLNVDLTYRKSYDQVLAGYGNFTTSMGFHYATAADFAQLLIDAGIVEGTSSNHNTTEMTATGALINLLGVTWNNGHGVNSTGILANDAAGYQVMGLLGIDNSGIYTADSLSWNPSADHWYSLSLATAQINQVGAGSFLVRDSAPATSVPEPRIWALLGGSLLGFGLLHYRTWKRGIGRRSV